MAESKSFLDQAKDLLDKTGAVDTAKSFLQDKEKTDDLKKKATELGQKIAPDSLDDKVGGAVDSAFDFLKNALGGK